MLTAIRYQQFKITFSEKEGGHWDDPLLNLGRPRITNLLTDPFERQTGDVNRQMNEHKTWVLTPILGVMQQHLAFVPGIPCPSGRPERRYRQDDRRHSIAVAESPIARLTFDQCRTIWRPAKTPSHKGN